jgi:hypothetical protein
VPKRDAVDIFTPELVVWAYEGSPQQALRTLLDLVHPVHPDDKAYDVTELRAWLRQRGITPRIARKGIESSATLGKHRWVIELPSRSTYLRSS